ncbi:hypothetical protein [Sporomusa aerivorans]
MSESKFRTQMHMFLDIVLDIIPYFIFGVGSLGVTVLVLYLLYPK